MQSISKVTRVKIFSDGASRGNPGPSAMAFLILAADDKVLERSSRFIGIGTNNQAEYKALLRALEKALNFTDGEVSCYLDSELVVNQLNGEYKVRNPDLKTLWFEVNRIRQRFRNVSFEHVPRTNAYVQQVDEMANEALENFQKPL